MIRPSQRRHGGLRQGLQYVLACGALALLWSLNLAVAQVAYLDNREILILFYAKTKGDSWRDKTNWLTDVTVCEWYGINCYGDSESAEKKGHIKRIDLTDNKLEGIVPLEIFNLPYLDALVLRDNPDVDIEFGNIGKAEYLEHLAISNTGIKSLTDIDKAPTLHMLHLTECSLGGEIPWQIYELDSLTGLFANYNGFTGKIDTRIGKLKNLKELYLFGNDLTGSIPEEIGELTNLKILALGDNAFSGQLPARLSDLVSLNVLAIPRGSAELKGPGITGSLPSLNTLEQISDIRLENQKLSGPIPSNFLASASKGESIVVDLKNNDISGTVPQELDEFWLMSLFLTGNKITGISPFVCDDDNDGWMGGDVGEFGCDAILCPKNTFNKDGRQSDPESPCLPCNNELLYFGSTECKSAEAPATPKDILLEFYTAMGGDGWTINTDWKSEEKGICKWYGVRCEDGNVVGLILDNNNLDGQVPQSIWTLPLDTVDFSENSISFSFEGIDKATKLEYLYLNNIGLDNLKNVNQLKVTSIRELAVSANNLAGTIPEDLFGITSLEWISISHNTFTGTLHSTIGLLTNLDTFNAYGNSLTGGIPTELGMLGDTLSELVLSENDFDGPLPEEFDNLVNLEELSIHQTTKSGTGLTGSLPDYKNMRKLSTLHLNSNSLYGKLPHDLLFNSQVKDDYIDIDLRDNQFSGWVPSDWHRFDYLNLELAGNRIGGIASKLCDKESWQDGAVADYACDAILCPQGYYNSYGRRSDAGSSCEECEVDGKAEYFGSTECAADDSTSSVRDILQQLYYATSGNDWVDNSGWIILGNICDWMGITCNANKEVVKLDLSDNGLSGSFDKKVFTIKTLREIDLQSNPSLTITLDGLEDAESLEVLYVSETGLKSLAGIGKAKSLRILHITSNDIEGPLPDELFDLTVLEKLYANYNRFSGRLSSKIGNLESLVELFLLHNRFTGQLPAAIGNLHDMKILALAQNDFSGTLPEEFNELESMEILSLQREGDTGDKAGTNPSDPPRSGSGIGGKLISFSGLKNLKELYLGSNSLIGTIPYDFLDSEGSKTRPIVVDLIGNQLSGIVPASLTNFDTLTLYLAGNRITEIPQGICSKDSWMSGEIADYKCNAFLCPPNTYSVYGRQSNLESYCRPCIDGLVTPFYGSFECAADNSNGVDERDILTKFYNALDGDNWKINENWLDSSQSICSWHGISCESTSVETVSIINLMNKELKGDFPSEIFNLPNLQELRIGSNDELNFSFDGIGNAFKLEYLNLDSLRIQSLSGIEKAQNLVLLHLMGNHFDDVFPAELFQLPKLEVLYLSNNDIGGSLPDQIATMTNLVHFSCYNCALNTPVPAWVAALPNLEYLRLDNNLLHGDLPIELNNMTKITHIDLSGQTPRGGGITGTLLDFNGCPNLSQLYLNKNKLQGTIPASFISILPDDRPLDVDLSDNLLTGPIPTTLSRFTTFDFYISNNQITELPQEICDSAVANLWNEGQTAKNGCKAVLCPVGSYNSLGYQLDDLTCKPCTVAGPATLYMGSTNCDNDAQKAVLKELYDSTGGVDWTENDGWTGGDDVCEWFGIECNSNDEIVRIILEENNVKGDIPTSIFTLATVEELILKSNEITFSMTGIENAKSLRTLYLSDCGISSIDGIGKATSLRSLHLTSNQISSIPDELYGLVNLENLYLNYNGLGGTLSTKIGNLAALKDLFLFHNAISGQIPTEIGLLGNLEVLALGENLLTGPLPPQVNGLQFLEIIALQREVGESAPGIGGPLVPKEPSEVGGGLTGPLLAFDNLPRLNELYLGSNSFQGLIPTNFLAGVEDKTQVIKVDLTLNELKGGMPEGLSAFSNMKIFLGGNDIDTIPDALCDKDDWMGGDVNLDGCDAILCPPDTFNEFGRYAGGVAQCRPCPYTYTAEFYGSIECKSTQVADLTEKDILLKLYESTGGSSSWADTNKWGQDDTSICQWHGITCSSDGSETVSQIHLQSNRLTGTVPPVVFQLKSLETFNVRDNDVDFEFTGIDKAESLKELYLDLTKVSSLKGISNAKGLKTLHLQQNDFGGNPIPDEVFELPVLKHLYISESNFGGTLSDKIGDLTNLVEFYCHGNNVRGEITSRIGDLKKLEVLVLSENNFIGKLPDEINGMTALKTLFIDSFTRNTAGLSGKLPDFAGLTNLAEIYLGSNSFTGTVPSTLLADLSNKSQLVVIDLKSNQLTGNVPGELKRFSRLNIDLAGNRLTSIDNSLCSLTSWMGGGVGQFGCNAILCPSGSYNQYGRQSTTEAPCQQCEIPAGTLPSPYLGALSCTSQEKKKERLILEKFYNQCGGANWKNKNNWMSTTVDVCQWYGISCKESGTVDSILMGSNNVIGTPPTEIFQMINLRFLWLYSNPVTFSFEGIGEAKKLTSLLLDSTKLDSLAGIGEARSLVDLDIRFNNLGGNFPSEFSNLVNLETLSCADNNFSGALPSFIPLSKLKSLRMANNNFDGPLPDLATHEKLKSIDLSDNKLSGPIPRKFLDSAPTDVEIFVDLSSNDLTGEVPGDLARFEKMTLYLKDNAISGIDPDLCKKDGWNDGDVESFNCDGLLCPAGSFAHDTGRASRQGTQCSECQIAQYYGATSCTEEASTEASGGTVTRTNLLGILGVTLLFWMEI